MLVFEVAERHDIILRLKNEINDIEQQLKQKDTHIQFKDEIIKKLRQQRRSYLKVCHSVYCSVVVGFSLSLLLLELVFFLFARLYGYLSAGIFVFVVIVANLLSTIHFFLLVLFSYLF